MSVYIRGMEMPKTGLYLVSVDNTDGRDKTVVTAMKANDKNGMNIIGSYELIPVNDHGRLIDADALTEVIISQQDDDYNKTHQAGSWARAFVCMEEYINITPTIIPADKEDGE